jgi:hypothetical protein
LLLRYGREGAALNVPTLETRKAIDELNAEDLIAFPISEFASDEDESRDETKLGFVRSRRTEHVDTLRLVQVPGDEPARCSRPIS